MALSAPSDFEFCPTSKSLALTTLSQERNPTFSVSINFSRLRREKAGISMKQVFRERECIHKDEGVPGDFYNGGFYLQALQRLPIDQAMQVAARVGSFFWADAPNIKVWLCAPCASELNLGDSPRSISQAARRQA